MPGPLRVFCELPQSLFSHLAERFLTPLNLVAAAHLQGRHGCAEAESHHGPVAGGTHELPGWPSGSGTPGKGIDDGLAGQGDDGAGTGGARHDVLREHGMRVLLVFGILGPREEARHFVGELLSLCVDVAYWWIRSKLSERWLEIIGTVS
jgi:hypothetical protein